MKGNMKVIMGAIVVMVVILAIILGLVLVLLAELYCSLLFRHHRRRKQPSKPTNNNPNLSPNQSSLMSTFYSQGVLRAPPQKNLLDLEKKQPQSSHQDGVFGGSNMDQLMYICNPMYDEEEAKFFNNKEMGTPYETPETSPSRLDSNNNSPEYPYNTPPLTPMKKLPAEGSSVSLRDASSICTTPSDSNSINGNYILSSSSGSPNTSQSW